MVRHGESIKLRKLRKCIKLCIYFLMGCCLSQSFQKLKHFLDISAICQGSHRQNERIIRAVFWAYAYGAFFVLREDCMCGKPADKKTDLWSGEKRIKVISPFSFIS